MATAAGRLACCGSRALTEDGPTAMASSKPLRASLRVAAGGLRPSLELRGAVRGWQRSGQKGERRSSHVRMSLMGEDPEWSDDDYIVLGLAHCFFKDADARLQDCFVVEPIPAGALECMDNGGVTCYMHATATGLGTALKQDISLLPPQFQIGKFCEDFEFRTRCASRTWKRQHAQENLLKLLEKGSVRSDWNFLLDDKRILNMEYEVSDADNIKQDLSIDVYGRKEENEEVEIEKLYNV